MSVRGHGLLGAALVLVHLITPPVQAEVSLRGVSPANLPKYQIPADATFECLDGRGSVGASRINDEYCDCLDGSDEPGTSACPHGSFYCANWGHEPRNLDSSFVDDGICDCCDGTDEAPDRCQDTCESMGRARRVELTQRLQAAEAGLLRRGEYVQEAAVKLAQWDAELARLRQDLARQEPEKAAAEALRDRLQEEEQVLKERKEAAEKAVAAALPSTEEGSDETVVPEAGLEGTQSQDTGAVEAAAEHLAQVEGEERAPERRGWNLAEAQKSTDEPEEAPPGGAAAIATGGSGDAVAELAAGATALAEARKAASAASLAAAETKRAAESLEGKLAGRGSAYGPGDVWVALADRCFTAVEDKYAYEVCPYGGAKQQEGGSSTTLGRWEGLSADGTTLTFSRGQQCWNGPARSLRVATRCGDQERLSGVAEPSRCEYTAELETPAACTEEEVQALRAELARYQGGATHDEL